MEYYARVMKRTINSSADRNNASLTTKWSDATPRTDWFSDELPIPFGQIEDLTTSGDFIPPDVPIDVFKNIRVLRVDPQIQCGGRYLDSLINLADAGFQAGHRLMFAPLRCLRKADLDGVEKLRELVEEALIEGKVT